LFDIDNVVYVVRADVNDNKSTLFSGHKISQDNITSAERLLKDILRGMDHLHRQLKSVHRDIILGNFMTTKEGGFVVIDICSDDIHNVVNIKQDMIEIKDIVRNSLGARYERMCDRIIEAMTVQGILKRKQEKKRAKEDWGKERYTAHMNMQKAFLDRFRLTPIKPKMHAGTLQRVAGYVREYDVLSEDLRNQFLNFCRDFAALENGDIFPNRKDIQARIVELHDNAATVQDASMIARRVLDEFFPEPWLPERILL
jgi:hypothetical protein